VRTIHPCRALPRLVLKLLQLRFVLETECDPAVDVLRDILPRPVRDDVLPQPHDPHRDDAEHHRNPHRCQRPVGPTVLPPACAVIRTILPNLRSSWICPARPDHRTLLIAPMLISPHM